MNLNLQDLESLNWKFKNSLDDENEREMKSLFKYEMKSISNRSPMMNDYYLEVFRSFV